MALTCTDVFVATISLVNSDLIKNICKQKIFINAVQMWICLWTILHIDAYNTDTFAVAWCAYLLCPYLHSLISNLSAHHTVFQHHVKPWSSHSHMMLLICPINLQVTIACDAVLNAPSPYKKQESDSWEEEIQVSRHARSLRQQDNGVRIPPRLVMWTSKHSRDSFGIL